MKVALMGGRGFIGSHICRALLRQGDVPVVVSRQPASTDGADGIVSRQYQPDQRGSLRQAISDCEAVVFLPGILHGSETQFRHVHVELAQQLLQACQQSGIRRYLHMSALGADPHGPSRYQRSKGEAEQCVRDSGLDWTVFRPSVVFGRGDSFISLFARLTRWAPVLPLAGARARFQPVWVEDVAAAFALALHTEECVGQTYDLAGPDVFTLEQIVQISARLQGRSTLVLPLPDRVARLQAAVMEQLPRPLMSRDNIDSMQVDNISMRDFPAIFGRQPASLEAIAATYIGR